MKTAVVSGVTGQDGPTWVSVCWGRVIRSPWYQPPRRIHQHDLDITLIKGQRSSCFWQKCGIREIAEQNPTITNGANEGSCSDRANVTGSKRIATMRVGLPDAMAVAKQFVHKFRSPSVWLWPVASLIVKCN